MLRNLLKKEKKWLEKMLEKEFLGKKEILKQIENSKIYPNYKNYYISLKFHVEPTTSKLPYSVRVPIEMRVYEKNEVPTIFLLHVANRYIYELEIYKADSSQIKKDFCLENVEIIINSRLI